MRKIIWQCAIATLIFFGALHPALADEVPFFPVWIDGSADLSSEATSALVDGFAEANPDPEHIVVWIHGFATTRSDSDKQFGVLTKRLTESFAKFGRRPAVVGIQWDSAASFNLFSIIPQYHGKTLLARKTGRHGARRFLLALQQRFPDAKITLMGHSMGCEVAMAAVRPTVDFGKNDDIEAYEPDAPLNIFAAILLGADLDFDLGAKSRLPLKSEGVHLLWLSENSLFRPKEQDSVLGLRAILSGKALGASFPLMTEEQYDGLLGHRAAVFDKRAIPSSHKFLLYYDQERIDRVVSAILSKSGEKVEPPPELQAMDAVMDAPNTVEALSPFLDAPLFNAQVYAMWRLEHLMGVGSKNFANGHLQDVAYAIYHRPRAIRGIRKSSSSPMVREGIWPSQKALARAGAPPWASRAGYGWTVYFRGEVVYFEDNVMIITTTFGDRRAFDITTETNFTPSRGALKVGSKVEVQGALKEADSVTVIPLHTWLVKGYAKEAGDVVPAQ